MDSIFGVENYRNEIVWKRFDFHADARRFGRIGDRILFYSKTQNYKFNRQRAQFKKDYIESKFTYVDERGRTFCLSGLAPPGGRGPVYEFHGITRAWRYTKEKMLQLEKEGRIYTKWRVPRLKRYLDELEARGGAAVHELWDDIHPINSQAKERLGYPTQKPISLLERILKACSDEGDWVLDPFCGCGTAVIAAEKLRRHWVGIDITWLAINLVKGRLNGMFPGTNFVVEGEPRDMGAAKELANYDRYQFQCWALSLIDARPVGSTSSRPRESKKGADKGVDGWMLFSDGVEEGHFQKIVVQVKSGHTDVADIREFSDVISTQNAAMGIFLTLQEPTKEMIKKCNATNPYVLPRLNNEYPRIQILTIQQLLKGERPKIPTTISAYQQPRLIQRVSNSQQQTLLT
jgi:site-specific DNA-methyltransferase (adenine-specific)